MTPSTRTRRLAVTRGVSPSIGHCALEHLERVPIDPGRAQVQHEAYENCLRALGCHVMRLPVAEDLPDSVFVEDVAVVLDGVALVTRPGAPSRRPETGAVADSLAPHRPLVRMEAPATLDGGDVLAVGRTLYVGRSRRTNADGIAVLEAAAAPRGYAVKPVDFAGCLHLKSAVTLAADGVLVVQPAWVAPDAFDAALERIEVDPQEPFAANVLRIGDVTVCAEAFPRTRRRLEARGIAVAVVDVSEIAKAEGALTCCSLVFEV